MVRGACQLYVRSVSATPRERRERAELLLEKERKKSKTSCFRKSEPVFYLRVPREFPVPVLVADIVGVRVTVSVAVLVLVGVSL